MGPDRSVLVRPARQADFAAISALLGDDEISRSHDADRPHLDGGAERGFAEVECDPNSTIYVLDLQGEVVGCAQLTTISGVSRHGLKRALVEGVRVRSDLRGRRLGRELMDELVDELIDDLAAVTREGGCGLVQLTSDKRRVDAHRFYVSLGCVQSHEGFKLPLD